jgi:hypothetical protein
MFGDWACRSKLRRKASTEIRTHKRPPAFAVTFSYRHWCCKQSASPCPSHAGGNSLPCQLNCVALRPSIPGPHPVCPPRAIEPCSSHQSAQVVGSSRRWRTDSTPELEIGVGLEVEGVSWAWRWRCRTRRRRRRSKGEADGGVESNP